MRSEREAASGNIRFNVRILSRITDDKQCRGLVMMGRLDREDEWVMAQVALGKREWVEPLVRRHGAALLGFLERMAGDRHRAEELFQEVFLAIWVKRQQYQPGRPFKPWLYAIAANKCHEAARRRKLPAVEFEDDSPWSPTATEPSPEETLVAVETAALVGAAVTRLPAQQRAVVLLRIWEGMSYAEIAEAVGRTEATVRSHMHHGLAALRKMLEPLRKG